MAVISSKQWVASFINEKISFQQLQSCLIYRLYLLQLICSSDCTCHLKAPVLSCLVLSLWGSQLCATPPWSVVGNWKHCRRNKCLTPGWQIWWENLVLFRVRAPQVLYQHALFNSTSATQEHANSAQGPVCKPETNDFTNYLFLFIHLLFCRVIYQSIPKHCYCNI